MLGEVLAQDLADPAPLVARREAKARQQLTLRGQRLGARYLPAHGEPLEQVLDGALPGVLARGARGQFLAGAHAPVLLARPGRHRAAQYEQRALAAAVLA